MLLPRLSRIRLTNKSVSARILSIRKHSASPIKDHNKSVIDGEKIAALDFTDGKSVYAKKATSELIRAYCVLRVRDPKQIHYRQFH